MKIYKIYAKYVDWDCCKMCAVLAENEEQARKLAIKHHSDLKDNIREVEEIPLENPSVLASDIKWG